MSRASLSQEVEPQKLSWSAVTRICSESKLKGGGLEVRHQIIFFIEPLANGECSKKSFFVSTVQAASGHRIEEMQTYYHSDCASLRWSSHYRCCTLISCSTSSRHSHDEGEKALFDFFILPNNQPPLKLTAVSLARR